MVAAHTPYPHVVRANHTPSSIRGERRITHGFLVDPYCVERHRDAFADFVKNDANIVVADEDEIHALLGTDSIAAAIEQLATFDVLFAVTRSEKGSVIVHGDTIVEQTAEKVADVIDTTGAGDAFNGFLATALAKGLTFREAAEIACAAATLSVTRSGARTELPGWDEVQASMPG